jgi:predicted lipid-binding transport protein (Tim44 family)
MEGLQFIDIIILAMVAGFIVLRLRSVLGSRSGHEPSEETRPSEGFARGGDNVVTLPPSPQRPQRGGVSDIEPAYQGTELEPGLVQLKLADPSFSATKFLEGAAKAFEFIVSAYAKHDADSLKPLLSGDVYARFAASIQDREDRGETMNTELVVLKPPKIESIDVDSGRAAIAVRFQSEQINIIKDRDGKIIEGDRDHVDSVTDIWTFARETSSQDPNWLLIATRSVDG